MCSIALSFNLEYIFVTFLISVFLLSNNRERLLRSTERPKKFTREPSLRAFTNTYISFEESSGLYFKMLNESSLK